MPLFTVDRHDRVTTVVNATRVVVSQGMYVFQAPHGTHGWRSQYRIPIREVAAIDSRVVEPSGAVRWDPEEPVHEPDATADSVRDDARRT